MPDDTLPSRPDRRVRRTREALRQALLALLVERGWDAIDVQSLCERADIGRSTFYLHHGGKEDLLRGSLADLRAQLRMQAPPGSAGSDGMAFVAGLITHAHEQQAVFRALLGRRSGWFVHERFQALLVEMVREELAALAVGSGTGPVAPWVFEATAHSLGGALFRLLVWWLGEPRTPMPTPQEIEALFQSISRPALKALPPGSAG
jgi:AcrR family transcriptional regulator